MHNLTFLNGSNSDIFSSTAYGLYINILDYILRITNNSKFFTKMSVLQSTAEGWILSHLQYINKMYEKVVNKNESEKHFSLQFNKTLFDINSVFLRQNQLKNVCSDGSSDSDRKTRKRKKSNLLPDDFLKEVCTFIVYFHVSGCLYKLHYQSWVIFDPLFHLPSVTPVVLFYNK